MTVIVIKTICLESKYLTKNINVHLLNKIQQSLSLYCSKDIGHVINVIKIIDILNHEIDRANGANIFSIQFEAEALKPEPGLILSGTVCMIYKDGIFIEVLKDRQKMLIPTIYLKEYVFDESVPSYNNNGNIIQKGDTLTAKVTASQYNNKTFSCFGSIV
jgi:DNA-directed RNA polymerase subunit E'/Rpb7